MRVGATPATLCPRSLDPRPRRRKETVLQRLFSTFPGGWPGTGLLLLRAAVGLSAIAEGTDRLISPDASALAMGLSGGLLICGTLLLVGFLTPIAGLLACLVQLAHLVLGWYGLPFMAPHILTGGVTPLVLVVTFAIVLLGPGALSLDAYLFGRREIVIPHDRRPSP